MDNISEYEYANENELLVHEETDHTFSLPGRSYLGNGNGPGDNVQIARYEHRHASDGHLRHFSAQHQPLVVQQIEAVSPSSSLVVDNDIHEHVDENDYTMHSPTMGSLQTNSNDEQHTGLRNDHHGVNSQPIPPPPSEQTAREQLIERERQGRLERERARLKRRLAISRERDEEDEAFAEVDRLRESVEDNSMDIMNLTDIDDDGDSDGSDGERNTEGRQHEPVTLHAHEISMHSNAQGASITNDFLVINNGHNALVQGNAGNGNIASDNADRTEAREPVVNENRPSTANPTASPLGYTMERFLLDGVVAVTAANIQGRPGDSQSMEANNVNLGHESLNVGMTNSVMINSGHQGHDDLDNDSNTNNELVNFVPENQNSSMAEISDTVEIVHSSAVLSTSPVSRVASSDIGIIDLTSSSVAAASSLRPERDESYTENETAPRLARLTEAEIVDLADIDYASVGNLPPRSERDDHDFVGLGRISNIGSDQTRTTMQESMSVVSADMNVDIDKNETSGDFNTNADMDDDIEKESITSETLVEIGTTNMTAAIKQSGESNDVGETDVFLKPEAAAVIKLIEYNDSDIHGKSHGVQENDSLKMPARIDDTETKFLKIREPESIYDEKKGYSINLESGIVESLHEPESSSETYNLPNRVIRPGFVQVPKHRNSSEKSSLHRRSLTTPNMSSFIDDFDYCKYDLSTPTSFEEEKIYSRTPPFNTKAAQYGSVAMNASPGQHKDLRSSKNDIIVTSDNDHHNDTQFRTVMNSGN